VQPDYRAAPLNSPRHKALTTLLIKERMTADMTQAELAKKNWSGPICCRATGERPAANWRRQASGCRRSDWMRSPRGAAQIAGLTETL